MKCLHVVFITVMALFAVSVMAGTEGVQEPNLIDFIAHLTGDKAEIIVLTIGFVGFMWAQLRQLIPAQWLAKLPRWLVSLLEWFAANKGHATNEVFNDPGYHKALKENQRRNKL